jgi:hypothetical protein
MIEKKLLHFALCICYFLWFFKNYGHNGYVVFFGWLMLYLVGSFLVAHAVHAPSHNEYDDECWKKHNYHGFTAFAFAF